jgi:hypothetical protein
VGAEKRVGSDLGELGGSDCDSQGGHGASGRDSQSYRLIEGLERRIATLEARVAELERENAALRAENADLKRRLV